MSTADWMPAHDELRRRRAARRGVPVPSPSAAAAQPLQRPSHVLCAACGTDDVESTPLLRLSRAIVKEEPSALGVTEKSLAATGGLPAGSRALSCAMMIFETVRAGNGGGSGDEGACAEPCLGCGPVGVATCGRDSFKPRSWRSSRCVAAASPLGVRLQGEVGGPLWPSVATAALASVASVVVAGVEFDRVGDVEVSI